MGRTVGLGLGPSFQVTTAGSGQESRPFHLLHGPLGLLSRTQARILENPLQGSPGSAGQARGQQGRYTVLLRDDALGVPGLCPPLLLCPPEVPGRWLHARDSLCPSGSAGGSRYICSSPTAGPPERAWGPKVQRGLSGLVRRLQVWGSLPRVSVKVKGGALVSKGTVHAEARDQASTKSHPSPEWWARGPGSWGAAPPLPSALRPPRIETPTPVRRKTGPAEVAVRPVCSCHPSAP